MREQKQETGSLTRFLRGGQAVHLNEVRVGWDHWLGQEGWLRWSAHPPGGVVCRDHRQYPAFAPSISEVAVGFWPFCILLFIGLLTTGHV